jgi:hypothetical protein
VRTPSLRVAALVLLALAAAVAATSARAHHDENRSAIVDFSFESKALDRRLHFAAYLPPDNAQANAHTFIFTLKRDLKRRPTFFAFYVGNKDWRFREENLRLDRELKAAGVPHVFALYPGAHEGTVWSAHAKAWLQLAADHLAAPSP